MLIETRDLAESVDDSIDLVINRNPMVRLEVLLTAQGLTGDRFGEALQLVTGRKHPRRSFLGGFEKTADSVKYFSLPVCKIIPWALRPVEKPSWAHLPNRRRYRPFCAPRGTSNTHWFGESFMTNVEELIKRCL